MRVNKITKPTKVTLFHGVSKSNGPMTLVLSHHADNISASYTVDSWKTETYYYFGRAKNESTIIDRFIREYQIAQG